MSQIIKCLYDDIYVGKNIIIDYFSYLYNPDNYEKYLKDLNRNIFFYSII